MDYKYDAFISYRHAEKDTLIASEIQKSLERFSIPKPLRVKTGKQRFNRVFRDVEELPISSNLTEDIEAALKASEYLIVICSYRTSESDWVKREIDTFLELHDYNKQLILTVLVEGEPDEVIPEVLRHDNITHYLADGTFYCKDEVVEPLAADYRMPIPKARKIELPRLAAAMLGCNYDDIIRRRKAYRRTRLLIETAVISLAAIALMTYIGFMLLKIQDGLRNTQLNQSRYLATQSQKLLEDGDRIGAIQLALAALENSDGTKRPVTSEAEYALSLALGAYSTKGSAASSPLWRYEISSAIVRYASDSKANCVAALDATGQLHIWDRNDHNENIWEDKDSRYLDFKFDKDDNLIIVSTNYIALFDSNTHEVKWKYESSNIMSTKEKYVEYYPSAGYAVINCNDSLLILNATNGEVLRELKRDNYSIFKENTSNPTYSFSIESFVVNNDFSKIALSGTVDSNTNYAIFIYDVQKDKWICAMNKSGAVLKISFDKEGNLMVLRRTGEDEADKYAKTDEVYDTNVVLEQINTYGRSAWQSQIPSMNRIINTQLTNYTYTAADGKEISAVIGAFANKVVIIDKKTGKTVKSFELLESVIMAGIDTSNNTYTVVTRGGQALWIPLNGKTRYISSRPYFKEGILELVFFTTEAQETAYLIKDTSNRVITEYSSKYADSEFKGFQGSEELNLISYKSKCGDYLITFSRDGKMTGSSLKEHKVLWTVDCPKGVLRPMDVCSPDKKFAYFIKTTTDSDNTEHSVLIKVNCINGQIADAGSEFAFSGLSGSGTSGNKLYALNYKTAVGAEEKDQMILFSYDMTNDSVKKTEIDISSLTDIFVKNGMYVSPDGKKAIVYGYNTETSSKQYYRLMIDLDSGKFTKTECADCSNVVWNKKSSLFAESYTDGTIKTFSVSGEEKYTVNTEMRIPRGMSFNEDILFVLYNIDVLCSYDAKGRQGLNIDLDHGDISSSLVDVEFNFVKDYLFLSVYDEVDQDTTDIISISDNKSISSFKGFLCIYNTADNEKDLSSINVVCRTLLSKSGAMIGYFEYKTPEKLIKQAKEYLSKNGVKMSDDFKRKYGIE